MQRGILDKTDLGRQQKIVEYWYGSIRLLQVVLARERDMMSGRRSRWVKVT